MNKDSIPASERQAIRARMDLSSIGQLLSQSLAAKSISAHMPEYRDREYTPLETLVMFITQIVSPHSSLQAVVAQRNMTALIEGRKVASSSTGAYSEARQRLPFELVEAVWREIALNTDAQCKDHWLWHSRRVMMIDGTSISMPDTKALQSAYPQPSSQAQGCGFPLARMAILSNMSSGSIQDVKLGRWSGKKQGELSLFRQMLGAFRPNDVVVADALYDSYWTHSALRAHGVDSVFEINGNRKKPGKSKRVITLERPNRPEWMSVDQYQSEPKKLRLRVIRCERKGYETRYIVTTLLDAQRYSDDEIRRLYLQRWCIETDLRSFKVELGAGILRCKSLEMLHKELSVHLLAFNLIQYMMNRLALESDRKPREISFTLTRQHLLVLGFRAMDFDPKTWGHLSRLVSARRVGNRPRRVEPRAIKRRPRSRNVLDLPRKDARQHAEYYEK